MRKYMYKSLYLLVLFAALTISLENSVFADITYDWVEDDKTNDTTGRLVILDGAWAKTVRKTQSHDRAVRLKPLQVDH